MRSQVETIFGKSLGLWMGLLTIFGVSVAKAGNLLPPQGTEIAVQYDAIYEFLLISSFISFVLVVGGMIYFVWKYRRLSPNQKTAYITHNHTLEFLWSFIPFLIFMFVFGWGWYIYAQMRTVPADALEVAVYGKKWAWKFVYKNGKEINATLNEKNEQVPPTMVVPLGRPVKLIMTSTKVNPEGNDPTDRAVIHSFFIPAFRIKQDVVPGRYSMLWFKADQLGEFNVFCAEYCGASHYAMRAIVKVVTPEEFQNWLASEGSGQLSLADKGKELYATKACIGCHSLDGTRVVGPSWKGLWGRAEEMEDGQKIKVDEAYIRESILAPNAKIVKSYPAGQMPVYAGQLSDEEISSLIEFIKTVK